MGDTIADLIQSDNATQLHSKCYECPASLMCITTKDTVVGGYVIRVCAHCLRPLFIRRMWAHNYSMTIAEGNDLLQLSTAVLECRYPHGSVSIQRDRRNCPSQPCRDLNHLTTAKQDEGYPTQANWGEEWGGQE